MLVMIGALAACAGPRSGAMTAPLDAPHIINETSPFYMSLAVTSVTGAHGVTNSFTMNVKTALEQSLQLNTMLATNAPKYHLSATIEDLKVPIAGFSMTVTVAIHYVIAPTTGGPPVFDQTITLPYTAAWGDAFVGTERARIAIEGAIRVNVTNFISALAAGTPIRTPSA